MTLFLTLPAQPNAVRLRVWRALKTLGCATLRNGIYLLPESHSTQFDPIVEEVRSHGGQAYVLSLSSREESMRTEILSHFDRSESYERWQLDTLTLESSLSKLKETDARRRLRVISESLQALHRIDYYAGTAAEQARIKLEALRQAVNAQYSLGEPKSIVKQGIPRLDPRKFQGKRWISRSRPWVDRLACAWLIRRFIDVDAKISWLADPAGSTPAPRGSVGFDYNGARFTHVGSLVSFEVMVASFGLDDDPALEQIGRVVHFLDVGGLTVSESSGLEAVLSGLRAIHSDDNVFNEATSTIFDALYASFRISI